MKKDPRCNREIGDGEYPCGVQAGDRDCMQTPLDSVGPGHCIKRGHEVCWLCGQIPPKGERVVVV